MLTPAELARRVEQHGALTAHGLRRWLLAEGFAVCVDGGLAPTAKTIEFASVIG